MQDTFDSHDGPLVGEEHPGCFVRLQTDADHEDYAFFHFRVLPDLAIIPILQTVVLPWFFDIQEDWKQYQS